MQMVICAGYKHDSTKCMSPFVKKGELYCRITHDPLYSKGENITNTDVFRVEDLRKLKVDSVQTFRYRKDIYTDLVITDITACDLDHVFELHLLRDCFDNMEKQKQKHKRLLIDDLKAIVNEKENLGFTQRDMNIKKFECCKNFADDFRRSSVKELGFFSYFYEKGMSRKFTKNIQREMKDSIEFILDKTCVLNLGIYENIFDIFAAMKLE